MDLYNAVGSPPKQKYNLIQVLRFIAALMVLILHSSFYTSERLSPNLGLYNQGVNGVDLFFTISGFVMIISSGHLATKKDGWRVFAIKRITRIVPIYWIVTTYKVLLMLVSPKAAYHSKLDYIFILKSYFFIPAVNVDGYLEPFYGVGWTLNFEMFFYLLFTIALAFKIKPIPFLSIIFLPLAALSFFVDRHHLSGIDFYANLKVLDFLLGMIAAQLILSGKKLSPKAGIAFLVIGLLYLFAPYITRLPGYLYNGVGVAIASFLVILGAAFGESSIGEKTPRWLIFLGAASYSTYLVHPSVAPLVPTIFNKLHLKLLTLSIGLSIVLAIAVSLVFYMLCEQPLTRFFAKREKKAKLI